MCIKKGYSSEQQDLTTDKTPYIIVYTISFWIRRNFMKKLVLIAAAALFLSGAVFAENLSDLESLAAGSCPRGIVIADIDGNRINEVIVANFGAATLIGQENTTEPESSIMVFSGNSRKDIVVGKSPRGLAAGDLDNNGIADFVTSNYGDGTISIVTEKGTKVTTLPAGKYPVGVAIGDVNGDKKNDVAVAVYGENKVVVYLNGEKEEWQKLEAVVPGSPTDLTIGKIGGDTVIVSANYTSGTASVLKIRDGALVNMGDLKAGGGVCKIELADATGDKINDLISANFYDNTVSVLRQNAAGSLDDQVVYKLNGSRPNGMAVADINNDGLADVVTANRDSDTIDILMQKNNVLELALSITVTGDEKKEYGPVEVAVGDINGDGLNDIAFTHMRSNTVRILYQVKLSAASDKQPAFAEEINEANTYNYPNPCVDKTTIRFSLAASADVRIIISDLAGKQVWGKVMPAAETRAGINSTDWNVVNDFGARAANGVYLLNVFAGDKVITKKIAVIK
jgi:hypothetical protein